MKLKEIKKTLEKYANYVIQQARSNLTKGNSNVNEKLAEVFDCRMKFLRYFLTMYHWIVRFYNSARFSKMRRRSILLC